MTADNTIRDLIIAAIAEAGSERRLARRIGVTQPAISKILKFGRVSPEMAIRLEAFTGHHRSVWRPDLWHPDDARKETAA